MIYDSKLTFNVASLCLIAPVLLTSLTLVSRFPRGREPEAAVAAEQATCLLGD